MHAFMTPEIAEQRRTRFRQRAEHGRLVASARNGCGTNDGGFNLRALGPADVENMRALFDRLSWRSRYLRFMSPTKVTAAMLRHLAAVDHDEHEAVGAFEEQRLIGSAHYFRTQDDPTHAEIAAEVVDDTTARESGRVCCESWPGWRVPTASPISEQPFSPRTALRSLFFAASAGRW